MAATGEQGAGARRIGIVLHDFAAGGTERIILRLAYHWVAAGRDVTILCGHDEGPARALVAPGVKVRAIDPPVPRGLGARGRFAQRLARALVPGAFDLLVAPGNYHLPILAGLVDHGVTIPMVGKLSNPLDRADLGRFRHALFGRAKRAQAGAVERLVAMSDALAREARRALPGVAITVVPEPIIEGISPIPQARLRTGPPRLLVAGRLVAQKRVDLALHAFAAWREPGAMLTIAGDGAERVALETLAGKLGIASRTHFPGTLPGLSAAFAAADVLLSTSTYEGFPATLVEAIVAGVPVVTTPSSVALPEILSHPSFGTVAAAEPAALAQALSQVWSGPPVDETERLALAARHDAAASAAQWLAVLDAVVAERD
ncbi:MAG: glycosyltransferase [Sphingomicrobium sp.]